VEEGLHGRSFDDAEAEDEEEEGDRSGDSGGDGPWGGEMERFGLHSS
jgi:hypothetical protein